MYKSLDAMRFADEFVYSSYMYILRFGQYEIIHINIKITIKTILLLKRKSHPMGTCDVTQ